ncbi:uncharacterized protein CLUP02_10003 [Colletotrichum lupini]|uniref:Uncharacterized protein n=1 Tax=Colletotrichum lupini TaxID=145971 RepID=A0A9Q8SXG2_9PEZI|nr:uncharacterized protein CLUP02_10003 [Colletotrichum lupini]UQC84506.1 hypothetical protein CLUP02_10003 [Colletotrichum lupini]
MATECVSEPVGNLSLPRTPPPPHRQQHLATTASSTAVGSKQASRCAKELHYKPKVPASLPLHAMDQGRVPDYQWHPNDIQLAPESIAQESSGAMKRNLFFSPLVPMADGESQFAAESHFFVMSLYTKTRLYWGSLGDD